MPLAFLGKTFAPSGFPQEEKILSCGVDFQSRAFSSQKKETKTATAFLSNHFAHGATSSSGIQMPVKNPILYRPDRLKSAFDSPNSHAWLGGKGGTKSA